jgi:hypothetical protein
MIKAACHCGAVRFELEAAPEWVLDCNCTLCRRYGALWAYPQAGQATILKGPDPGATETYMWGDKELAVHRCRACGCVTHTMGVDSPVIYGVNARMMLGLDPKTTAVRQVDNGDSGVFWTHSNEPVIPNRHGPMPPPGPDDWR